MKRRMLHLGSRAPQCGTRPRKTQDPGIIAISDWDLDVREAERMGTKKRSKTLHCACTAAARRGPRRRPSATMTAQQLAYARQLPTVTVHLPCMYHARAMDCRTGLTDVEGP
jgi:hypothetical protein